MTLLFAEACARAGQHERAARAYGEAAAGDVALGEEALLGLDALLASNPRLAEAWLVRARIRMKLAHNAPALADFTEAARLSPRLVPEVLHDLQGLHGLHGWGARAARMPLPLQRQRGACLRMRTMTMGTRPDGGELHSEEPRQRQGPGHPLGVAAAEEGSGGSAGLRRGGRCRWGGDAAR